MALDTQRERIYSAKFLKQDTFALHDWHSGLRTNVAQAQNGRTVGHHQTHIPAPRQVVRAVHVLLNFQTGLRDARRIGQGQIMLVLNCHRRDHLDLPALLLVQAQWS